MVSVKGVCVVNERKKKRPAERKRRKALPASYGEATPEQVAKAILTYRPQKPPKPQST